MVIKGGLIKDGRDYVYFSTFLAIDMKMELFLYIGKEEIELTKEEFCTLVQGLYSFHNCLFFNNSVYVAGAIALGRMGVRSVDVNYNTNLISEKLFNLLDFNHQQVIVEKSLVAIINGDFVKNNGSRNIRVEELGVIDKVTYIDSDGDVSYKKEYKKVSVFFEMHKIGKHYTLEIWSLDSVYFKILSKLDSEIIDGLDVICAIVNKVMKRGYCVDHIMVSGSELTVVSKHIESEDILYIKKEELLEKILLINNQ